MNYTELKSCYIKNLKTGLGISLIIHFIIILFLFILKGENVPEANNNYGTRMTYIDLSPKNANVPPAIVDEGGGKGSKQVSGTPVPVKGTPTEKEFSNTTGSGDSTKKGSGGSGSGIGSGGGGNVPNVFKKSDYLIAVEMQPEPIGGLEAIDKKVIYPESARNYSIQGKVFLQVYINENGEVVFAEVLKGLGYGCDDAAIKAIKLIRFKAGKLKGKYVKVQMSIPVKFKL